jgi:hypothetical protein
MVDVKLAGIARRVAWFQEPEATLAHTDDFLCRVMALATWEDTLFCMEHYGRDRFRKALRRAPPGLFTPRAWNYWTLKLEVEAELPRRELPVDATHS